MHTSSGLCRVAKLDTFLVQTVQLSNMFAAMIGPLCQSSLSCRSSIQTPVPWSHDADCLDTTMQLFSRLLQQGTFVLFTSNKTPAELYKNGLNRQYFLPFIRLLQKQLAVVEVRLCALAVLQG